MNLCRAQISKGSELCGNSAFHARAYLIPTQPKNIRSSCKANLDATNLAKLALAVLRMSDDNLQAAKGAHAQTRQVRAKKNLRCKLANLETILKVSSQRHSKQHQLKSARLELWRGKSLEKLAHIDI